MMFAYTTLMFGLNAINTKFLKMSSKHTLQCASPLLCYTQHNAYICLGIA
jgi:hypothetical protein